MDNDEMNKLIEALHTMIIDLSKKVQSVRIENSNLKNEIMCLRASIAISKGNTAASDATKKCISELDMKRERVKLLIILIPQHRYLVIH